VIDFFAFLFVNLTILTVFKNLLEVKLHIFWQKGGWHKISVTDP